MLIFIRSQNAHTDGRLSNHIKFCKHKNIEYRVIEWDRVNAAFPNDEKTFRYSSRLDYDSGNMFRAIIKRLGFAVFILKKLRTLKAGDIWFCDLDMAWTAFFVNRKSKIICDVYDHLSVIRNSKVLGWYETFCFYLATEIIVVSNKRKEELVAVKFHPKTYVIRNLSIDFND